MQPQRHHHLKADVQRALIDVETRAMVRLSSARTARAEQKVRAGAALLHEGHILRPHDDLVWVYDVIGSDDFARNLAHDGVCACVVYGRRIDPMIQEAILEPRRAADARDDPLDASGVHPEAYPVVRRILAATKSPLEKLIWDAAVLRQLQPEAFTDAVFGVPTVTDILREL